MVTEPRAEPIDVRELMQKAADDAYERHDGVLPAGFTFGFRRYGNKGGGRWRGVDPHGCWIEGQNEDDVWGEMWWMVAAYEKDQERANA